MASSDDEGETIADTVSDYYFCDGDDEPLSFSKLPLHWNDSESDNSSPTTGAIFLRGNADNGLQKLYKAVKAWKYDLKKSKPEISVLSKDNHWIKLQKPRKSFEDEIRSILIFVHCLSYLKSKPEASAKSLWDHLSKVFSSYNVRPSEKDLRDHMNLIRDAVDRDKTLANAKFLAAFLENPRKRKSTEEPETLTKPSFIVDDTVVEAQDDDFFTENNEDSESDEEEDHFDSVCAICDNGGSLTCCDGKCFRSFHATPDSEEAEDSNCQSLGLTPDQVESLQRIPEYKCENCLYSLHQCFVCCKLGSSDKSSGAEVFRCSSAQCGHFYHPKCVAKLLEPKSEDEQKNLLEKIGAGEPFICPAHKCNVCKQTENETVKDLQFAVCRRCPTSYHRKCLPRDIMFESQVDEDIVRAWDNLLSKSRALIYCTKHDIDEDLSTPARTIIFQDVLHAKKDQDQQSLKPPLKKKKALVKETGKDSEHTSKKPVVMKSQKATKMEDLSSKKRAQVPISSNSVPLKKKKVTDTSKKSLKRSLSAKVKMPSNDGQPSLGSRLFDLMNKGTENSETHEASIDDSKQTMVTKSVQKEYLSPIDEDSKQRILDLMKDASSSMKLEDIKSRHRRKVPSTHAGSSRVDKSIILARVEGSVEALHVALKKLDEGCSLEDAMAVCTPGDLDQLLRWKDKLRVYLAPFLHGMRYTSFGRHFTKVEKLEKIVDKLKYYVEDGDTVVDFCCGANDFSTLMKKNLDEMGKKKCCYKNYDIMPPKNDFNFEKRDWMSVRTKELPDGSNLIMGLNPPFGKNAALANQFIQQAVRFMPKLIVLIVPPETERLDSEKQKCPYDLVWEDEELLAGKSFYLPGSVDVNAKQIDQWNNTTPLVYLWSRPDQTSKHKSIAQKHGHIPTEEQPPAPVREEDLSPLNEMEVDPPVPVVPLPVVINKVDPEESKDVTKSNSKKAKKESPKKKQQNAKDRNRNSQESKTEKHEDKHIADETQKVGEDEAQKMEVKDFSDVTPRGKDVERRYKSPPQPSCEAVVKDYSSKGQSVNQHVERRYNATPPPEEAPYKGGGGTTTTYRRRPDSGNLPTYSMSRPEPPPPVQYQHQNRGVNNRGGSYYDDMGGRGYPHHEPPPRYGGHPDPPPVYNRTSTSTMQRYAPRLDELNHTRMSGNNNMDDNMNHSRMGGNFGRPEPPPPNRGGYGMHGPGGFAPGPYNPYAHRNSSGGWLNE